MIFQHYTLSLHKPEELDIVPVPLDTVQLGLDQVHLEVAVELHGVPRLDHGGQHHVLIQGHTYTACNLHALYW